MIVPPMDFTWVSGESLTYDVMQERVTEPLTFLLNSPKARVRKNTAQTLTTGGTGILVPWDYEEVDNDNMFNPATPTRLTPKTPGWYVGEMGLTIGTTSSHPTAGIRYIRATHSSGEHLGWHRFPGPGTTNRPLALRDIPFFGYFNGTTDYVEVLVFQTSGATMTIAASTDVNDHGSFGLRWLAAT